MTETTRETYTNYHNDGTLWAKGFTKRGMMDGYWEWFRMDGSKMRSGYFDEGKQVGMWTTYSKSGRVVRATDMDKKHARARAKKDARRD